MAASKFKTGQKVRQVMPKPEEGHIVDIGIDRVEGERLFLVGWTDETGQEHEGWYREDELELAPEVDASEEPSAE